MYIYFREFGKFYHFCSLMEEPPDPGGTVPPVGENVTIFSNDSSIDTDGSIRANRKRIRAPQKLCKHCNKRRKHHTHDSGKLKQSDCHCDSETHNIFKETPPTPLVNESSHPRSPKVATINDPNPNQSPHVGRTLFESTDISPFIVHIQRQSSDNATTLHPVAFGHFLKKSSFKNIINGSLKRIGRNRLTLSFNNYLDANAFIKDPCLTKQNFKAFIPTFSITRMGLVRGVPTERSVEDIIENISVPIGCGKVIKARRLNYKVHGTTPVWKPSQTVVLTFDGQVLPKRVFLCYNSLPVELYTFPTIQCFNCCRFGHTKTQCRSAPRCYKCGQSHSADTFHIEEDTASCFLCGGLHFATSKSCQEFERQKLIKAYMAQNCVSYIEALKLHPPPSKSYADVLVLLQQTHLIT